MLGEEEERQEAQRPRVIDKRVSARMDAASSPPPAPDTNATSDPTPEPETDAPQAGTTPEDEPAPEAPGAAAPGDDVWTPEREAEAQAIAEELARVPALDWLANAAVTLANVAAAKIHTGQAPDAQLAIDGLGALLDGLGDRLGEAERPLKQTLAQLRFAYSQAVMPPGPQGGQGI